MAARPFQSPFATQYDVVIVGGAVIGSSIAFWLSEHAGFDGSILAVERDSSYAFSSTALSASGIRQQYSNPINVKISQFGVEFIKDFQPRMQRYYSGEKSPDLGFRENGYLYCHTPEGVEAARERVAMQRGQGADTVFLDAGALADRFPWLNVEDLGGGSYGAKNEGWFDSVGLMNGFKQAARRNGVEYVNNQVVDLAHNTRKINAALLATGDSISCGLLINAAGPRAAQIAQMAGISLPVEPRKRHSFVFASAAPIAGNMPMVIDLTGTYVRPENDLFLTGNTPTNDGPAALDDFETDHGEFEQNIWPNLYHRIPRFDALKLKRFWTGHYAYNTLDHNAVVGFHPKVKNIVFANGFSGHGLQQAPAIGRGISELIVSGQFETLDLSVLGFERIISNEPFLEAAVI